jgi:hypothetical protein
MARVARVWLAACCLLAAAAPGLCVDLTANVFLAGLHAERTLHIPAGTDPVARVREFSAQFGLPPIRQRFLSKRFQNAVYREASPVVGRVPVQVSRRRTSCEYTP